MTSKERVRTCMEGKKPDRIPATFEAVWSVEEKLLKHYGYTDYEQLLERFEIDIVPAYPKYIGPELKSYQNEKGEQVNESWWGYETTMHTTSVDTYETTTYFPLNEVESVEDVDRIPFPDPDWFDYSSIRETCDKYPDKAIIVGHEGPFQMATFLMEMDRFFILMVEEPEIAKRILERINEFEMEYYRRILEAGEGKVDVLRPHDDYGTQISLFFSLDMWREFFRENTRKLVELAHRYGAFYQQHSCGAVEPLIPEFIACGVDALEPLQKVKGLEAETLAEKYRGQIVFHGGIDTQGILPFGTAEDVRRETRHYMETLGKDGGYILMASQGFEGDVPIENIEAVYEVNRYV
ncbi:MAG: uroporphyrinogen decarboxylase family protein [Fusicatenibacter sp.]|nr:uroporphyrinogen decarboxylase family protein [Fusicatenibacter sp.]